MDILQNIYNSLVLEKQGKERIFEQIINKPIDYDTQLTDAIKILKEIATISISVNQFEAYLQPPATDIPQGTVSQPKAPQSISEDGLGVVQN